MGVPTPGVRGYWHRTMLSTHTYPKHNAQLLSFFFFNMEEGKVSNTFPVLNPLCKKIIEVEDIEELIAELINVFLPNKLSDTTSVIKIM